MSSSTTPGPIKSGRPRRHNKDQVRFWNGKLYALLKKAMPQHVMGDRLNPPSLAAAIETHKFTVYRWLNDDKVSPAGAKKLIDEAKGNLTPEDMTPFLLS